MRALVVDDSRAIRVMLRKMLTELGFAEVLEAGHGREAIDSIAANGEPDVMLVDWNMPVMNGLELIRAVRKELGLRSLPICMVTTETEYDQMVRALAAGANEYVMKPFTRDVIESKLELLGALPRTEGATNQ